MTKFMKRLYLAYAAVHVLAVLHQIDAIEIIRELLTF